MSHAAALLSPQDVTSLVLLAFLANLIWHLIQSVRGARAQTPAATAPRPSPYLEYGVPVLLALCIAWLYAGAPIPRLAPPVDTALPITFIIPVYDQWQREPNTSILYQWKQNGPDRDDHDLRTPFLVCEHYPESGALQQRLLPTVDEVVPDSSPEKLQKARHMDPSVTRPRQERRKVLEEVRRKALSRCVLEEKHQWGIDRLDVVMHYFMDEKTPSLFTLVGSLPSAQRALLAPGPGAGAGTVDILLSRDKRPLLRVLSLVPVTEITTPSPSGKGGASSSVAMKTHVVLQPVILDPEVLLAKAVQWVSKLQAAAITKIQMQHCLCAAHFGIFGSGLHLYYEPNFAADATAGTWHVWLNPRLVSTDGKQKNKMGYLEYLGRFPYVMHMKLNMSGFVHAGRSVVEYVELSTALHGKAGDARIAALEKWWLLEGDAGGGAASAEDDTDESGAPAPPPPPIMAILKLEAVAQGAYSQLRLDSTLNSCLQYCVEIENGVRGAAVGGTV